MDQQHKLSENDKSSDQNIVNFQHHKHAKLVLLFFALFLIIIIFVISYLLTEKYDVSSKTDNVDSVVITSGNNEEKSDMVEENSISNDWLEFEGIEYKIKIPNGWDMIHQDNDVLLMSCDSMPDCYDLEDGVKATVTEEVGGRDGLQGLLFVIHPKGDSIDDYTSGYVLDSEIIDGYLLYVREVVEEPVGDFIGADMPVGTKEFLMLKKLDDGRVSYIGYSVTPAQEDPTDLIEEMISTLTIK